MKTFVYIIATLLLKQKTRVLNSLGGSAFFKGRLLEYLLKKYFWPFLVFVLFLMISLASYLVPLFLNKAESTQELSLDQLVPKGFVLMPIEIRNAEDIRSLIGSYGVVDLYAYSEHTGLPDKKVADYIKVIPLQTETAGLTALIPEKSALDLFEYSESFYAVIQNPTNKGSKIYKKKRKKALIIVEENF